MQVGAVTRLTLERHRGERDAQSVPRPRLGPSRCAGRTTASTAATGVDGASDTSSWSWPYSVWICSIGQPGALGGWRRGRRGTPNDPARCAPRTATRLGRMRGPPSEPASWTRARRRPWRSDPLRSNAASRYLEQGARAQVRRVALLIGAGCRAPRRSVRRPAEGRRDRCGSGGRRRRRCSGVNAMPLSTQNTLHDGRDAHSGALKVPRADAAARTSRGSTPARSVIEPGDEPDTVRAQFERAIGVLLDVFGQRHWNLLGRHECASQVYVINVS